MQFSYLEVSASFVRCKSHRNPIKITGHNIKWDHFEILASGKTDYHCKINETLFIQELSLTLNTNLTSNKLSLY